MSEERKIQRHVAFILDGNGRWAKAKGMPRNYGHVQGAKAVEQMLFDAGELGIEYVTVYAFSTENWNRPETEVSALMALFKKYLKSEIKTCMKNNVRSRVIGDKTRLPGDVLKVVEELEETTKDNTGLTFSIAINYGSRDEITRAVRKIASKVESGEISASDIDEQMINDNLDTGSIPDPDLLIRTCGEQRLSNYLLWQLAYTEFYFTDICWPDFNKEELEKAIDAYNHRTRRFGGLKKGEE